MGSSGVFCYRTDGIAWPGGARRLSTTSGGESRLVWMDEPSRHVLRFLEALSANVWGRGLYGGSDGLWVKLVRRGLHPTRPGTRLGISTGPRPSLTLGTSATIAANRQLEFLVELRHDGESWLVETGVYVDLWPDEEGQREIRSFPDRRAATLDDCLAELDAAIADLATCDDVLDEAF